MKIMMRLSSEEFICGVIMLLLILTNADARDNATGTPQFIERGMGLSLNCYAVFLLGFGLDLVVSALVGRYLSPLRFAVLTLPLLFYIAATAIYTITNDLSKSGVVIYTAFYLYLVSRCLLRERKGGT